MSQGYIFAILTIFLFGSWAVPTKTLKIDPRVQAFWLTVGHCALSIIIFLLNFSKISFNQSILPFAAGILWSVGIAAGYVGIKHLGITRALGLWIPIVLSTSALWGLLYFGEIKGMDSIKIIQTVFALFLLISASLLVIFSSKDEKKLGNVKAGILGSVTLGLIHGSFFVPLRASDLPIFVTFLPLTIGMVVASSFIVTVSKLNIKNDINDILRMMFAGVTIGGGNYTAILTTQFLGVSRGYPLTQLGIIVNSLWEVLVFKEVPSARGKVLIAMAIILAIVGAFILNSVRVN